MADSTNSNQIYTLAFKVDVSDAKGNLKEYKEYIDNLKGSLLALDKDSDQYKENAKALKEAQQKLNEVMDVAKGKGEAVAGSYDALSKEMSELKKQFKATGDEAERAQLAVRINEINNQLKEMDASVGVFSRNVGNYKNAFEDAFKNVMGNLDQISPELGNIGKQISSLVPLIKKSVTAATTGLKGVKAAIAGTGVGLLVVALGLLVENWDKVSDAIANWLPWMKKANAETEAQVKANTDLLEVNKEATKEMDFQARVMQAQGKSTLQILAYKKAETEALLANTQAQIAETNAKIASLKAHSWLERLLKGENKQIRNLEESLKSLTSEQDALTESLTKLGQDITIEEINIKAKGGSIEVEGKLTPILNRLEEFGLDEIELLKLQTERRKKELELRYEAEKKLLEKNGIDTTTLTIEYVDNLIKIEDEYNAAVLQKQQDADAAQINELLSNSESIEDILEGLFDYELMMQEARNIAAAALDAQRAEDEKKALEERKKNISSFASSTADIIGMVADAWESSVKSQIESGKLSEEEGKKQFEQIKAMQTAVAIINTLSAGVAAYDGIVKATGGWGLAAAIAQMVAVIGTGMAQVAKIQSTTLGTRNTQITSVGTPNLGSIVNDYQPNYVQNITNATETEQLANALTKNPIQAYVVESSVTAKQELARSRENETTY